MVYGLPSEPAVEGENIVSVTPVPEKTPPNTLAERATSFSDTLYWSFGIIIRASGLLITGVPIFGGMFDDLGVTSNVMSALLSISST